ncbi:hypothetical protein EV363DRAFT_1171570 [Boletus edulis]|nr:hypothetical protein EV363DRAFT_1171570 [Boletus edulis]
MSTLHFALAIIVSELCMLACWWVSCTCWHIDLTTATKALKSNSQAGLHMYMTCRDQYLQASVETLHILEQSFYLLQQGDPDAVSSAVQEYRTSDIPTMVNIALKDVFTHYDTTSKKEKVDMICNIITQNHTCLLLPPFRLAILRGCPHLQRPSLCPIR